MIAALKRRGFITMLGGAAVVWPLAVRAQNANKPPTIDYLGGGSINQRAWADTFAQRLHELGWVEGRTVVIEYRWADERSERASEIAAEFVRFASQ
jgi:putative ABC transport system substrate-binding protein